MAKLLYAFELTKQNRVQVNSNMGKIKDDLAESTNSLIDYVRNYKTTLESLSSKDPDAIKTTVYKMKPKGDKYEVTLHICKEDAESINPNKFIKGLREKISGFSENIEKSIEEVLGYYIRKFLEQILPYDPSDRINLFNSEEAKESLNEDDQKKLESIENALGVGDYITLTKSYGQLSEYELNCLDKQNKEKKVEKISQTLGRIIVITNTGLEAFTKGLYLDLEQRVNKPIKVNKKVKKAVKKEEDLNPRLKMHQEEYSKLKEQINKSKKRR